MAGAPKYKVYDGAGKYQAACKQASAAAVLMAVEYTDGSVRLGHGSILFKADPATIRSASYDSITEAIIKREQQVQQSSYDKAHYADRLAQGTESPDKLLGPGDRFVVVNEVGWTGQVPAIEHADTSVEFAFGNLLSDDPRFHKTRWEISPAQDWQRLDFARMRAEALRDPKSPAAQRKAGAK